MMATIFNVLKILYRNLLREELANLIDNPESQVDEFILGMLDALFNYEPE